MTKGKRRGGGREAGGGGVADSVQRGHSDLYFIFFKIQELNKTRMAAWLRCVVQGSEKFTVECCFCNLNNLCSRSIRACS